MIAPARAALLTVAAIALGACDQRADFGTAAASDEARFGRETLALLLQGDVAAVRSRMDPKVAREATPAALASLLAERPPGAPSASRLVAFDQFVAGGVRRADFTFEFTYPQGFLLGLVVVDSSGPVPVIAGLHLKRMAASLERVNAFRWSGRTARHYLVLLACVLVPLTIGYALVACAREEGLRLRWAWLLFIAVGIGRLGLNWTTGAVFVRPSILFLGTSAWRAGPYAPWFLSFALPVGAVAFLARRRVSRRG